MRVLSEPVKTYSQQLSTGPLVQPSQVLPNFGPCAGLTIDLTVTVAGGTATQTSQTIDNLLQHVAIDDQYGKSIMDLLGTDLSIVNDVLQPRGVRTAPPAITTNSAGNGSAEWKVFLPVTIGSKDMPAVLKVTLAPTSALVNAGLVSAGTVNLTLVVRAWYPTEEQPTLRIKASSPPHQQGDNAIGPYLPSGFQAEAIAFTLAAGDGNFGYLTLMHAGATLTSLEPLNDFVDADTMLMQSGHLSGEFIVRVPIFVVDSTSVMTVNLSTDTALRLYTIATVPQKKAD